MYTYIRFIRSCSTKCIVNGTGIRSVFSNDVFYCVHTHIIIIINCVKNNN